MTKEQQQKQPKRRESAVEKQQQQHNSGQDQPDGAVPPRNLIVCAHCGRLFSKYSITLHQPRCADNPHRQLLAMDNKPLQQSASRPETPRLKRRNKPVSKGQKLENSTRKKVVKWTKKRPVDAFAPADAEGLPSAEGKENDKQTLRGRRKQRASDNLDTVYNNAVSCSSVEEVRPATRTLSSSLLLDEDEKPQRSCTRCVCFVCGRRISASALSVHELECERGWRAQRDALLSETTRTRWRVDEPRRCAIPSVDGTADQRRVEAAASESARRAQYAECTLCVQRLPLAKALAHKCDGKAEGATIAKGAVRLRRK